MVCIALDVQRDRVSKCPDRVKKVIQMFLRGAESYIVTVTFFGCVEQTEQIVLGYRAN